MSDRVSFACPSCRARLKASVRLVGRSDTCPGCGVLVQVPPLVPGEQGPVLIWQDHPYTPRRELYLRH